MKTALAASTLQLSALAWAAALLVDSEPWSTAPSFLIGFGLLTMSTVSTVGMVVVGGRWAHRLGLATLALCFVLASFRPIDWVWWIALTATVVAVVSLLSPGLLATIRKLPAATGPPPRAIAPPLVLLTTPVIIGLVGNEATPWALLVVGVSAPGVALLYTRVFPGGLWAMRLVWPVTVVALGPLLGPVAGLTSIAIAVVVAFLAWDGSVKASYHPPQETGTTFPIPPELAPGDVLDAAEVDDQGRKR